THSMSSPRSWAARDASRPGLPRPLIPTRPAMAPPSAISDHARSARTERHRRKHGSLCVRLPTRKDAARSEAAQKQQYEAAGDSRDDDPVVRLAVAGGHGWNLDAHAVLRG